MHYVRMDYTAWLVWTKSRGGAPVAPICQQPGSCSPKPSVGQSHQPIGPVPLDVKDHLLYSLDVTMSHEVACKLQAVTSNPNLPTTQSRII